ncbi:MAG TPA: hypothetical protein VKB19_12875 [Pedobacter sp.]|nr:hypothetical protein [Pedobacter sp.]
MSFLPYQKLTYHTLLTEDEAIEKLAAKIDPDPPFLNWKFGKLERPFKGTLKGGRFELGKVVGNHGGSLPCIFGEIISGEKGARIDVTIKLSTMTITILTLFALVILAATLLFTLGAGISIWPAILFPLAIILFSYTVATLQFKFHASFIKDDLREVFQIVE